MKIARTLEAEGGSVSRAPKPPRHAFERERIASLEGLDIGTCQGDRLMQEIGRQAADLCRTSMGLVTLIYEEEQLFLGKVGVEGEGTDRDSAFCAYTILQDEPLVVEDALRDVRFRENPYVLGSPHVRFYAGAPIVDRSGLPLGSVCAVDTSPHSITSSRLFTLQRLATMAGVALETRRLMKDTYGRFASPSELEDALSRLDGLMGTLVNRGNGFVSPPV